MSHPRFWVLNNFSRHSCHALPYPLFENLKYIQNSGSANQDQEGSLVLWHLVLPWFLQADCIMGGMHPPDWQAADRQKSDRQKSDRQKSDRQRSPTGYQPAKVSNWQKSPTGKGPNRPISNRQKSQPAKVKPAIVTRQKSDRQKSNRHLSGRQGRGPGIYIFKQIVVIIHSVSHV